MKWFVRALNCNIKVGVGCCNFFLFDTVRRTEIKKNLVVFSSLNWVFYVLGIESSWYPSLSSLQPSISSSQSSQFVGQIQNQTNRPVLRAHSAQQFIVSFSLVRRHTQKIGSAFRFAVDSPQFPSFQPIQSVFKIANKLCGQLGTNRLTRAHTHTLSKYTHYQQNKPILIKNAEKSRTTSYALY